MFTSWRKLDGARPGVLEGKLRVAFLLYGVPQNGGTKVIFHVAEHLRNAGHEVSIYVPEPRRELPFPSNCEVHFAGANYPNAIGRVRWLSQVRIDADVAVATFHPTALALHLNQSPIERKLYYVQAYEPEFYSDSFLHFVRRWPMMLMAGASYLLPLEKMVNCEGSRKGLAWGDRAKCVELPPGIDTAIYRPRHRRNDVLTIGHISRKEWWKGSDYFFQAMKMLRARGERFQVRVAYDLWPDTHQVEYEAVRPRTEAELAEYYASVDVVVSTVSQKGFGYPPLEAMACGAVCVSTPMDFGRPGLDHVPIIANSAKSIVSAIESLKELNQAGLIREGLKTAAAYDWPVIGQRWCDYLAMRKTNS
jgi:glycosyltransferase involved in cell wall biosynthesis